MLKIHGVPIFVHTRKVILAALEKNLEFANEPVIPFLEPRCPALGAPTIAHRP